MFLISVQLAKDIDNYRRVSDWTRLLASRGNSCVELSKALASCLAGLAAEDRVQARRADKFPAYRTLIEDYKLTSKAKQRILESFCLSSNFITNKFLYRLTCEIMQYLMLSSINVGYAATLSLESHGNAVLRVVEHPIRGI